MPYRKPVILISGLAAGLLLFVALLAVQLNNIFFNSDFQKSAVGRLDIYERLLAPAYTDSRGSANTLFEAALKNTVTQDLFNRNVNSLVDGLIDFVSGRTNKLPDLYLSGDGKLSLAASAGMTPAAVEKINLQLLMMFSDEQYLNDVLSAISLVQFLLSYLPLFLLLLVAALIAAVSKRSPAYILDWMHNAVLSFFILSWLAAWFFGSLPWLLPFSGTSSAAAGRVVMDYMRYCTGSISAGILLSGLILFLGYKIALHMYVHFCKTPETTQLSSLPNKNATVASRIKVVSWTYPKRALSLLLISSIIYSLSALMLIEKAGSVFNKRNLDNAVLYIMGSISYNRYTDARNEDVCFLNIRVLDENDKKPVKNILAAIYPLDAEVDGKTVKNKETAPEKTDNDGTVSFLLTDGRFRLKLYSSGIPGYEGQAVPAPLSYDFSLSTPGRTDLTVILGSRPDATNAASGSGISDASNGSGDSSGNISSASSGSDTSKTTGAPFIPQLRIVGATMQYMP